MDHYKQTILLITTTLIVNAERWYSASVFESDGQPHWFQPISVNTGELKFTPVSVVKTKIKSDRNRWSFVKNSETLEAARQPTSVENHVKNSQQNMNLQNYKDVNKTVDTTPKIPTFVYNNTIRQINILKSVKPKKKLVRKRCPSVRPRQKKQLNLNETARTRFLEVFEVVEFDHVSCAASSGLQGVCLPEQNCVESGGVAMGTCADGYGTCCVTQYSCDEQSAAPSGWFTNPGFPSPSAERLSCSVKIDKATTDIVQIRLDFTNFELLPPSAGACEQDQFVISGQNVNNVIPILCGVNTGQHLYIEVNNVNGPITLSVQTVSSDSRLFSIKVTQLTTADELVAPPGCLQYFKEPQGYIESFNYRDKSQIAIARVLNYLNNLNYAICVERSPDSCSITYSNTGYFQIVNYDTDGLPVIPPGQAGVEIFNCPTDWLLIAAVRVCGDRLNDGAVLQDFALDAPVIDVGAGPIVIWFRSDGSYTGRGFRIQYQQNNC